jgi:hypothetical protein
MSHVVPHRINKCANCGCDEWCPPGQFYCSGHCRAAADERSAERFVGGSLENHEREHYRRNPHDHEPDDYPTVTQRNWRWNW